MLGGYQGENRLKIPPLHEARIGVRASLICEHATTRALNLWLHKFLAFSPPMMNYAYICHI